LLTLVAAFGKPAHIAVLPRGQKGREVFARLGGQGYGGETDGIETKFQGFGADLGSRSCLLKGRKQFFFEKKNQKTFIPLRAPPQQPGAP